jgi:hypothetical protein
MKKNLIFIAAGFTTLLAINTSPKAQAKSIAENAILKNTVENNADPAVEFNYAVAGDVNLVHTKAARNFAKRFKTATDVTWFEAADGYRAQFETSGRKTWVDYDKKGNWVHTIRIYGEKELPSDVRSQVKSVYYDYAMKLVHEIELPVDGLYYIVHLEGENTLIDLRIHNDEMEVLHEFVKSIVK